MSMDKGAQYELWSVHPIGSSAVSKGFGRALLANRHSWHSLQTWIRPGRVMTSSNGINNNYVFCVLSFYSMCSNWNKRST